MSSNSQNSYYMYPKNFFRTVLRYNMPENSLDGIDVPIENMIRFWYENVYKDHHVNDQRRIADWYIEGWTETAYRKYVESKFDSIVLTENFRLREENARLKNEMLAMMKEKV